MMKVSILSVLLLSALAGSVQASHYEFYSKPRQCYGWAAVSGERINVNLTTDIINKGLSKNDLIGTALKFRGLDTGKKIKIGLMCIKKYQR